MDNRSIAVTNRVDTNTIPIIMDVILLIISIFGVMANSTAMYILTSSVKIRKSKTYILLMNQSIIDLAITLQMILYLLFKYTITWYDMRSPMDFALCHVIHSQLNIAITTFCSSFNLVALSLERMASIVWPIIHRVYSTKYRNIILSVCIWISGTLVGIAFSFPVNGVHNISAKCYYWDDFPSKLHSQIYSVLFTCVFSVLPLLVMLISYTVMYMRISSRRLRNKIKLNVIKMLAYCVILYLVCHALRACLTIVSRFSGHNMHSKNIFLVGIVFLQINAIVNPLVYSFQYMDYKEELKRQLYNIFSSGKRQSNDNIWSISSANKSHNFSSQSR